MRAIIFDCDGVIADTEPMHFAAFQRVLAEQQISLTAEEYYRDYLAYDDRGCFERVLEQQGVRPSDDRISRLIERKTAYLKPVMQDSIAVFPGVADFVRSAAAKYPLAIASGALRHEVEMVVRHAGIIDKFVAIVTAEDVSQGKPNPESFLEARAQINAAMQTAIEPAECLVIEDSIHGINAARAAGMRCLAVTNSYPRHKLAAADIVVDGLSGLTITDVERLFSAR